MTINPIVLEIIKKRGIEEADADEFFSSKPKLAYDPFLLANMREGVDLLLKAIDDGKKIVIYGDYDVDGITSTALLMKVLGCLTDSLNYYIPSRLDEGYGLNMEAIDRIAEAGAEFIVTVDCGSSSKKETEYAHSLGIETLVTDHHNMGSERAEGIVINPRLEEDEYPFKGLAGVGVAYKLALSIAREREIPGALMAEMIELATVGTVADIMPMLGENRTLVKCGLRSIRLGCRNPGLRRLIERSSLDCSGITTSDISFGLAPKINAAGRLGDATLGVRLLLSDDESEIDEICDRLIEANLERRRLQDEAFEKGSEKIEAELSGGDFLIVEINDSHEGVLGIVAGKLRELVNRPVVVISRNGDSYKGTGRSIATVDLFGMLNKYRDRFKSFGGHSAACGFTIDAEYMDALKEGLNRDISLMAQDDPAILEEIHYSDAELSPASIDLELAEDISLLEPFGKDNEMPLFAIKNTSLGGWRFLKDDEKMARFIIESDDGSRVDGVIFKEAAKAYEAVCSGRVDLIGSIEINSWRNERKVQVIAREILPAGTV